MWMGLGFRVVGLVGTRRGGDSHGSCERELRGAGLVGASRGGDSRGSCERELRGAGLVGARRGGDSRGNCERESRGAYLGCESQIFGLERGLVAAGAAAPLPHGAGATRLGTEVGSATAAGESRGSPRRDLSLWR
jgi:hypothetical protein